ncbi:oxidoreductase [Streptomyces albus]|uniref:Oxidoreductase n=1 Tax=Streptomyces albus (strain ATCC 21838 / DSM 41398 / FERM P-419 / JCM 4703 / NBRC 107858) TaxID=1081613 RepID=A0A0B5EZL7_STRA4|nr:oxidoreductase [Streptomyces albus]AOU81577.1 oxidoreductase [Streptomyces albus]AYN37270.1 oxidoreductase [Streptomyces albus]
MTKVGISLHEDILVPDPERRRGLLRRTAEAGLDHVCVADHISFHDGTGFDGLVAAGSVLNTHDTLPVVVGIYLLGLRHPLLAARQLASLGQIAPGRLVLGVGVGGEDRKEVSNSGVDPATRGRRLDESLGLMRRLATGEAVSHKGEFFTLDEASILPAPSPAVPLVIGGKGDVAVRRTAAYGDGWLGIFCSARRFAQTKKAIAEAAEERGRAVPGWYGLNVWCGLDRAERRARELLAHRMESLYRVPYEKFQHVAPAGTPSQVAAWLAEFVGSGAEHVTLIPAASSPEAGIEYAAEVRALLLA